MAFDVPGALKGVTEERVLAVRHWTNELFSFRLTRPASFRFRSGEFVMLGLPVDGRPLLRAYSMASPAWDDGLDFYSIKVADGPLTSRLQRIVEGDAVLLGKKPTGTLLLQSLTPGRRLFLLSTGTGLAPFASLIREPDTYDQFEQVVLTQTCRNIADLAYGRDLVARLGEDPLVGEIAPHRLTYYPTVTREPFETRGRITDLIETGQFFRDLDLGGFDPATDRVMICGSMAMIADLRRMIEAQGFVEGGHAAPATYVVEKAFAD